MDLGKTGIIRRKRETAGRSKEERIDKRTEKGKEIREL